MKDLKKLNFKIQKIKPLIIALPFFFLSCPLFAQDTGQEEAFISPENTTHQDSIASNEFPDLKEIFLTRKHLQKTLDIPPSSSCFNLPGMPFFCKIEYKMEKAAKIPVRFRLGDIEYVDYLEGKRQ